MAGALTVAGRARATVVLAACAAGLLTLTACSGGGATARAPAGERSDAGVQLFQWTWDAIGAECTDVLGPAGYGFVLTSPPQEHVRGGQWWTAYQPVSYAVESRLGTREQFAAMVQACRGAGVEVYADAVVNHMTGQDEPGTGWAGTPYTHYDYPGLYTQEDFHHCSTPGGDIASYADAAQVQGCELLNLADLATETEKVRAALRAYLADLVGLGVTGFRIDAAKHVPSEDVAAVVAELPAGTAVLQEVIRGAGEPVTPEQYTGNGRVFEFSYGRDVAGPTKAGSWLPVKDANENTDGSGTYLPSADAVSFVANHDTERNGSTLSYADGGRFQVATVLLLTGTYGTPVAYSGYAFSDRDAGPVQDGRGAVLDATCPQAPEPGLDPADGEWNCEHRWPAVRAAVGLRAAVGDEPVTGWEDHDDVLAYSRGERGFVAVNRGAGEQEVTATTTLAPGTYCDTVAGPVSGDRCAGGEVRVGEDGTVTVTVPAGSAVLLHVGARPGR